MYGAGNHTSLITFAFGNQHISFEAMGFYQNGELVTSTWGLFAIGAISAALSLLVIFIQQANCTDKTNY